MGDPLNPLRSKGEGASAKEEPLDGSNAVGSNAESWAANKLLCEGKIQPLLTDTYTLDGVGEASLAVHHNKAEGKLGVLCLAPGEGQGIDDPERRAAIGEDKITVFRN